MKRAFLFVAGLVTILGSCTREANIAPEEKGLRHIRIQASIAGETRTSVEINGNVGSYSWDEDEEIAVLESESDEPREFTVSNPQAGYFEGEAQNDLIGAVSPAAALKEYIHDGTDLEYTLSLSGEYAYSNGTNAVMVAGAPTAVGDLQKFTFQHVAGLVMVTYENLPYGAAGLRFTTDKPIVGDFEFSSLDNVVITTPATGASTAYVMLPTPIKNETMNQSFTFCIPIPANVSGEHYTGMQIALVDDNKTDIPGTVKRMSSKTFTVAAGDIVRFPTVTLSEAQVQEAGYVRINSTDDLSEGQYLIVYEGESVAFDGSLSTLNVAENTIEVEVTNHRIEISNDTEVTNHRIEISNDTEAAEFTFAASNNDWTIKSASGKYIGRTSDSNGLQENGSITYTNIVSFSGDNVQIVGSGGAYLRFNANQDQKRFSYYKSTTYSNQKAIQLYKKVAGGPVGGKQTIQLYFEDEGPYYVNSSEAESFVAPALINPAGVPVTYRLYDGPVWMR